MSLRTTTILRGLQKEKFCYINAIVKRSNKPLFGQLIAKPTVGKVAYLQKRTAVVTATINYVQNMSKLLEGLSSVPGKKLARNNRSNAQTAVGIKTNNHETKKKLQFIGWLNEERGI